jgi:hypothetical protein
VNALRIDTCTRAALFARVAPFVCVLVCLVLALCGGTQDHSDVREEDGALGKMVGAHLHFSMRGVFEHYVSKRAGKNKKRKRDAATHTASMIGACHPAFDFFLGMQHPPSPPST